eukprot:651924-Pyramimonas_sp.AAC.1
MPWTRSWRWPHMSNSCAGVPLDRFHTEGNMPCCTGWPGNSSRASSSHPWRWTRAVPRAACRS